MALTGFLWVYYNLLALVFLPFMPYMEGGAFNSGSYYRNHFQPLRWYCVADHCHKQKVHAPCIFYLLVIFEWSLLTFQYAIPISGHGTRAGSGSPLSRRKYDYHHRPDFDNSGPLRHGRGFRGGRGRGRFRDSPPPYGRGRGGSKFSGRDFDGPRFGPGPFGGEGMTRNNPNVSPREGDWICPDPSCGNLNFARRDYCNKCNRLRFGPRDSPRRAYSGTARFSGLPLDGSPGRGPNGYRSPPRAWRRNGPKEYGAGPPHSRHGGGRFPDNHIRRERPDYREEDDFRERGKFDRPMPPEGYRDRGRDNFFKERRGFDMRHERRPLSPPPPAHRVRFARDSRERSRSPMRNGLPVDYRRDSYVDRGRGGRWGIVRDRADDHPY